MTPRRLFYTLRARKSRGQREQKRDATEAADHCPRIDPAPADANRLPQDAAPETNSERTANLLRGVWPKNLKPNAGSRYHPPAGVYPPESVERFFFFTGEKAEQCREDASGQLAHNWQGTANTGRGSRLLRITATLLPTGCGHPAAESCRTLPEIWQAFCGFADVSRHSQCLLNHRRRKRPQILTK